MENLYHKTIYKDSSRIAVDLPLTDDFKAMHENGSFPLIEDPKSTGKTLIIGMFVLRPTHEAYSGPIILRGNYEGMFAVPKWGFNVKGLDGGWLIAGGNVLDAKQLAFQYGTSDAVAVGSTTVAKEGVPHNGNAGYLWQPYGPANWGHVKAADPNLSQKIASQRKLWQAMGYLSSRDYPAQIVITQSGEHREGTRDILEASIFYARHPNGDPIEAYILTSEAGAKRIRERAGKYQLLNSIDDIIIAVSPPGQPEKLDIARVPEKLYREYDMKIVNHDGGQTVLSEFSKAGVLPQLNLTLGRNKSVRDILSASTMVEAEKKAQVLAEFDTRVQHFFTTENGKLPAALVPAAIITDAAQDVAVVTFDGRGLRGL